MVRSVFKVLSRRVADGEIQDIKLMMPEELRELWEPQTAGEKPLLRAYSNNKEVTV